jgi:glucans biosynthesis protein C
MSSQTSVTAPATARVEHLSRYKGFLSVLVVLIHTGITYGASGSWYYHDPSTVGWLAIMATTLAGLAQSFSMGAFFFISAYFLPRSLEKKGPGRFLLDRLAKLGIPYVVFYFLVNPLLIMAVQAAEGKPVAFGPWFGSGPLWFIEALFIFTLFFMAAEGIRKLRGASARVRAIPSTRAIVLYIVAAAVLGFAARILFPIGWNIHNLQLGFFPMYIILFCAGIAAGRSGWLERVRETRVRPWAITAGVSLLCMGAIMVLGGALKSFDPFMGGLTWQSGAYAAWEAMIGTALFITTFVLFARGNWRGAGIGQSFGSVSFGIYIFHAPVIILIAIALTGLPLYPALKYLVVAAGGVGVCWGLSLLLRKMPGLGKIF